MTDLKFLLGFITAVLFVAVFAHIGVSIEEGTKLHLELVILGSFAGCSLGIFAITKKSIFRSVMDSMMISSFLSVLVAPWHYIASQNIAESVAIGST